MVVPMTLAIGGRSHGPHRPLAGARRSIGTANEDIEAPDASPRGTYASTRSADPYGEAPPPVGSASCSTPYRHAAWGHRDRAWKRDIRTRRCHYLRGRPRARRPV